MADGMRWDAPGYAGNPDVKTPNLDALAQHGVSFEQALCPFPDCAMSRAVMLTGSYPEEIELSTEKHLSPGTVTLAQRLSEAGYRTAVVGRRNIGHRETRHGLAFMRLLEQLPEDDDYHTCLLEKGLHDKVRTWAHASEKKAPAYFKNTLGAHRSNLPEREHSITWVGNQAVRYIQTVEEPFFLWIGFDKPQFPFDPPSPWDTTYEPRTLQLPGGFRLPISDADAAACETVDANRITEARFRKALAYYYACISYMDRQIGRILATLTSRGISNNVILFCADHGDYMGQHGLIGQGTVCYDALLRIPMLIAGVTGQRRGVSDPALVEMVDLAPTLLSIAQCPIPASLKGKNLLPLLRENNTPLRDVAQVTAPNNTHILRTSEHKLISSPDPAQCAFYDLNADPNEWDNRYNQPEYRKLQNALQKHLDK